MRRRARLRTPLLLAVLAAAAAPAGGAGPAHEEFRVKRSGPFEFAQPPRVTRTGDRCRITFATKGLCDVTVAIEDAKGRIVRHLACGVLGAAAPPPLQRDAKSQALIWDGKDDQGKYVDDLAGHTVRVSLGLKPRFERTLFWSPHKRVGPNSPVLEASPEGVYVYEGHAIDQLRLFDHKGDYVRTVYPFPRAKLPEVKGLRMHTFPHTGTTRPLKGGFHQATLLTCGTNYNIGRYAEGYAVNALAARAGRLALLHRKLNRLTADSASWGPGLEGPPVTLPVRRHKGYGRYEDWLIPPRSAAFSPDGEWLYMTGFGWDNGWYGGGHEWLHVVTRKRVGDGSAPEVFLGAAKQRAAGRGARQFNVPTSLDVDARGRIYVADYMNDRVQVFSPDGKLVKSIAAFRPAHVEVHHKTGHVYVFTWLLRSRSDARNAKEIPPQARLVHLGPVENPARIAEYPLKQLGRQRLSGFDRQGGFQYRITLDSWTDPPTFWIVPRTPHAGWKGAGVLLLAEEGGKLKERRSFARDAAGAVVRLRPPALWRQRLVVDPKTRRLYVVEADAGVGKSAKQLVEIDPDSGKVRLVELPFDAEDVCFDTQGLIYLRTGKEVVRCERLGAGGWREVPWDYGEERQSVGFGASRAGRRAPAAAALRTPGHRSHSFWHLGGMAVNAAGHLVVTTCNGANPGVRAARGEVKGRFKYVGRPYVPRLYPGRPRWGEIHVFDKHGKPILEDVFPGMGHMDGVGIDAADNIYVMSSSHRVIAGRKYDGRLKDDLSETLIKVRPRRAKVLSASGRVPVPLGEAGRPDRSQDIRGSTTGAAWVEAAEWFYGGVGFAGKNAAWAGGGCCCWNARFKLDHFARSFAPEPRHFTVAVLDSAGNLILRVGRYGNADDGVPLNRAGGPGGPRPLGGPRRARSSRDEVALFHACYVATDTDRRLFIADAGNARLLSVRLDYHESRKVALSQAPAADR